MGDYQMAYLRVAEVAKLLNVHENTVRNWIRSGILRAHQLNPGGRIIIRSEDVDKAIDRGRILLEPGDKWTRD